MKNLIGILTLWCALIVLSCHDEIRFSQIGCCDHLATADSFGNATVFLPNVFTPNGDGLNDHFYVLGDSIQRIINFEIRDKHNKVVHHAQEFDYPGFEHAWDGKKNGMVQKGLYSVFLTLETTDGTIGSIEGKICNFPCGLDETLEKISIKGCHFAAEWKCWEFDDGCLNIEAAPCFE